MALFKKEFMLGLTAAINRTAKVNAACAVIERPDLFADDDSVSLALAVAVVRDALRE